MSNKKQWVVIDGVLECNPTKKKLKNAENCTYIYPSLGDDTVIETWWVDELKNCCINFAYSITQMESMSAVEENFYNPKYYSRLKHFERHGIPHPPHQLKSICIPKQFITKKGIINLEHFMY